MRSQRTYYSRGLGTGDWGLGTGDWGLGTGDWVKSLFVYRFYHLLMS
ncbi:hypothetical protein JYQ62_24675 [Nostoc sp. UHCC 0702]|nr:hypothetical protein JYQ62_24675 [Nostoc sp. UHCC 0702]